MAAGGGGSAMDQPEIVATRLGGETVDTTVELGGGDAVYCTPARTLIYRADGLLSDESVQEFDHDIQRLELLEGRRKTTVRLTDVTGDSEFSIPADRTEPVLAGVLTGVLRTAGDIDPDEDVQAIYRFSELTLVLTDARLLKHVGSAVWGSDREAFPFADATGFAVEEGTHATQVILEIDGRPERIKLPADRAGSVQREIEDALFDYHDVDSRTAFEAEVRTPGSETEGAAVEEPSSSSPGESVAGGVETVSSFDLEAPGTGAAADSASSDIESRLAALEAAIERQSELLENQQDLLERLVEELRRGR